MRTTWIALIVVALGTVGAQAGSDNISARAKCFQHADRNDDGVVPAREMNKEKPWEERADADGDGKVGPAEARMYRLQIIDINKDGAITVEERRAYYGAGSRS